MATDLLARIRGELDERILALRPLLSEYERLTAAAETLAAVAAQPAPTPIEHPPAGESPHPVEPALDEAAAGESMREPAMREPAAGEPDGGPTAEPPAQESTAEAASRARARLRERAPRGSAAGTFGLAMSLRTTPPIQPIARTPQSKPGEPPTPKRGTTEALAWLNPMPSAPAAEDRPTSADGGGEAGEMETPLPEDPVRPREPVTPAAAQQAILAALEHGSHTPGELVMVTAMSPNEIRSSLGRLARRGAVAKVKREGDGKAAYALPSVSARV